MTEQRRLQSGWTVIKNLGWPLLLGMSGYTLLMFLMTRRIVANELLDRYLTSHPVSYLATAMFCIGVASLLLKAWEVARQYHDLGRLRLEAPTDDENTSRRPAVLDQVQALRTGWREQTQGESGGASYLSTRIEAGLDYVERRGSADGLEDELKYQAELDADRQHESYALVRILIWATPMLGFLGTVIGISEALGGLSVGDSQNFDGMMNGLRDSLYVAFDTTALALTLSIGLMFIQFIVDRFEQNLLFQVEWFASDALLNAFDVSGSNLDPVSRSIERSGKAVLDAVETLVGRQSELWHDAFVRAQDSWLEHQTSAAETLEAEFSHAVRSSLTAWQGQLSEMTDEAEKRWQSRWEQLQIALTDNARRMQAQQEEFVRHGEVLARAVTATGEVLKLEQALNSNLQSLHASGNFEEAIHSLSAAIHLLNSRLGQSGSSSNRVELQEHQNEKAA